MAESNSNPLQSPPGGVNANGLHGLLCGGVGWPADRASRGRTAVNLPENDGSSDDGGNSSDDDDDANLYSESQNNGTATTNSDEISGNMVVETRTRTSAGVPSPVAAGREAIEPEGACEQEEKDDDSEECVEELIADPPARFLTNMSTTRQDAFESGCDSDGNVPPVNNTAAEERVLPDEKASGETPPTYDNEEEEEPYDVPPMIPVNIDDDALKLLKVVDLKVEPRIGNVTFPSGLKRQELEDRLRESLKLPVVGGRKEKNDTKNNSDNNNKKKKGDDMSEFAPGSHWEVLTPEEAAVPEPTNPSFGTSARAPTVPAEDADRPGVVKHNFSAKFDGPAFTGKRQIPEADSQGNAITDENNKPVHRTVPRTKGGPKMSFLRKHNLTKDSHPAEFFDAFLPLKLNKCRNSQNTPCPSVSELQQWTNMKALLSNAGTDECCVDFKPFTVKETQQHLGLYILNGLSPSPNLDLKFDTEDEANYSHFVDTNIDNGVRRHRHFRAFFSMQDPRKAMRSRDKSPLFKILPLVNWINAVGKVSWDLGINLSIDEQTISFQGRHIDKLRIACKAAGDGFQVDALCDRGFTHSICFRNEKPPEKHLKMGHSPLHARVVWLFDRIEEEWTRVWMDDLCISAKIAKGAHNHPKKVLIGGVSRKDGRGIPNSVLQEEQKTREKKLQVRGTVKAAVLQGDKDMPNLVAVGVCDTKPVHFITAICECIEWVLKTKEVWNEAKKRMEKLQFLRLNVNNDYNLDVSAVDVSDQPRNNCRFDHWLRNFKWWWAIACWGIGVLLVGSHVAHTSVMEMAGVPKKNRLSHYQFRLAVARVWIDKNGAEVIRRWKELRLGRAQETPKVAGEKRAAPCSTPSPLSDDAISSHGTYSRSNSSASTDDDTPSPKKRKSPRLDDNTLSASGDLKGRLDCFGGRRHLPMSRDAAEKTFNTKCALHRWAMGGQCEHRQGVLVCSDCLVPLCLDCHAAFHSEPDLVGKKSLLASKMEAIQKSPRKPSAPKQPLLASPTATCAPKKRTTTPASNKKKKGSSTPARSSGRSAGKK